MLDDNLVVDDFDAPVILVAVVGVDVSDAAAAVEIAVVDAVLMDASAHWVAYVVVAFVVVVVGFDKACSCWVVVDNVVVARHYDPYLVEEVVVEVVEVVDVDEKHAVAAHVLVNDNYDLARKHYDGEDDEDS